MKKVKVEVEKLQTSDGKLFELWQKEKAEIHEKMLTDDSIIFTDDGQYYEITDELPAEKDYFYHTHVKKIGIVKRIVDNTIQTCNYPLDSYPRSEYTKKLIRLI